MVKQLKSALSYLGLPIAIGLLVAMLYVVATQQRDASNPRIDIDQPNPNWRGPVSYSNAVRKAAPSVVNIYTRAVQPNTNPLLNDPRFRRLFNLQQQQIQSSLGSGVIFRDDGYILTNNHVVEGADEILVLLNDGRTTEAAVVGTDADTDLAVLKIALPNLVPITLGNPRQTNVGDVVLAIGNPYGFGQSVTQGIVSATGRNGLNLNTFENFIQTDAAINPGNSGGALVDAYGNLLGINTATLNATGVSFAIPADTATSVMEEIIEHGHVVRGWLGIAAEQNTPQIAQRFGLQRSDGLVVSAIYNGGPAHLAGIRPLDIIVAINGEPVSNSQMTMAQIADINPGELVQLDISRNGEMLLLTAVTGSRPEATAQ